MNRTFDRSRNLLPHQERFLDEGRDRAMLVWETGTGKTLASILWADRRGGTILVVCPKALKTNWKRSLSAEGMDAWATVMSKEEFSRDWQKVPAHDSVIVDEAHYFSGMKSAMSRNLRKWISKRKPSGIILLTATPYMSTPYNILVLGNILGYSGYRWSWPYFSQHYFNMVPMGSGGRLVPVVRKGAERAMAARVASIADVVRLSDCAAVPDPFVDAEYFSLTKEQEEAIDSLQDTDYIARWTKKHQICGGFLKGDEYSPSRTFPCHKLDRIVSMAAENPKMIAVCRYNGEIEMIADSLPLGKKRYIINGSVADKQAVLDEANAQDDCILLVNASCSEGWEAPTFPLMAFYSYSFSLKDYVQMKGRIQRINALQKCAYVSLVADGTIDEDVYKCITERKQSFHLSIYEKGK